MSDRISKDWEPTTAKAYGNTPKVEKGRRGELLLLEHLKQSGIYTIDYEDSREMQVRGEDLGMIIDGTLYTASVKTNLQYPHGDLCIEFRSLYANRADLQFHIDLDTGHAVYYYTHKMQGYLQRDVWYEPFMSNGHKCIWVPQEDVKDFLTHIDLT